MIHVNSRIFRTPGSPSPMPEVIWILFSTFQLYRRLVSRESVVSWASQRLTKLLMVRDACKLVKMSACLAPTPFFFLVILSDRKPGIRCHGMKFTRFTLMQKIQWRRNSAEPTIQQDTVFERESPVSLEGKFFNQHSLNRTIVFVGDRQRLIFSTLLSFILTYPSISLGTVQIRWQVYKWRHIVSPLPSQIVLRWDLKKGQLQL